MRLSAASQVLMDCALTITFISEMYRMKQSAPSWTSPLLLSTLVSSSPFLMISLKAHGPFNLMSGAIKSWFALSNGLATNSSTDSTQIASVQSTLVMALRISRSTLSSSEVPSNYLREKIDANFTINTFLTFIYS